MNYTLHQLQIFIKLTEFESVTKAAEALHLTQPAVSIQLKNFQNQFEAPLFEVLNRKVYITDFGKEVAEMANEILEKVEWINQRAQASGGEMLGTLKLAVVSTGKYVMPYFLSHFLELHQKIELSMDVTNKQQVVASLEANEVDFALVSIPPSHLQIEQLDLLPNILYLVGSHKIGKHHHKSADALISDAPLIYREAGSGTRQTMERYLKTRQINAPSRLELTSNEAVKQAVLAGLGISIMPIIGLKHELQNDEIKIIPARGLPLQTTWSLIWLKGKKFSPVAQAYLKHLEEKKDGHISKYFEWYQNFMKTGLGRFQ